MVEPHEHKPLSIENEDGKWIGDITPVDLQANRRHKRAQPDNVSNVTVFASDSMVELALEQQQAQLSIPDNSQKNNTGE